MPVFDEPKQINKKHSRLMTKRTGNWQLCAWQMQFECVRHSLKCAVAVPVVFVKPGRHTSRPHGARHEVIVLPQDWAVIKSITEPISSMTSFAAQWQHMSSHPVSIPFLNLSRCFRCDYFQYFSLATVCDKTRAEMMKIHFWAKAAILKVL